jgi:hypothetical protein
MVNKQELNMSQVQQITDWDLEQYFPDEEVFQEFLEMFSGDSDEDEIVERANNFAKKHNVPLKFVDVEIENDVSDDEFLWDVIVKEELWNAIQNDRKQDEETDE